MSSIDQDEFRASFFEEAEELLEALHDGLDRIETDFEDEETLNSVFRAVHSIKGGAGAFGLSELVEFAHQFETLLDALRSHSLSVSKDLPPLLRECSDHLADLLASAIDPRDRNTPDGTVLTERLAQFVGPQQSHDIGTNIDFDPAPLSLDLNSAQTDGEETAKATSLYEITFEADDHLFTTGNDPTRIFAELAGLGHSTVQANLTQVPDLSELAPESCSILWSITIETNQPVERLHDVFDFVAGDCRLEISTLEAPSANTEEPINVPFENLSATAKQESAVPSLSDILSDAPDIQPAHIEPAPTSRELKSAVASDGNRRTEQTRPQSPTTLRVGSERVDRMINLVGELVIKEAMLWQSIVDLGLPSESNVLAGLESLSQLAREIQDSVMAIRAQPIKPLCQRMSRISREAAGVVGKKVSFVAHGEATELDKTVIERLGDPLTHIVRNAVDHGLETPESREASGKPAVGNVTMNVAHRSGRVIIEVSDDGAGINRERVLQKAREQNLLVDGKDLTPAEIDNLLFLPGLSSKDEASELSGRGVGLDVVSNEIHRLGGRVSIRSTPEVGTTFSISLPLTLAVLDGMVLTVAGQTMIVPISAIVEAIKPERAQIHTVGAGGQLLEKRGRLIPIVDVGAFFGFRREPDIYDDHVLLLVETDQNQKCVLVVDQILDQRQVVIKSLETNHRKIRGIAAATILGDGRVALIVDPDSIIADARAMSSGNQFEAEVIS